MEHWIIKGRSVDGSEYYSGFGWSGDRQDAKRYSRKDVAEAQADHLDQQQHLTRGPDSGIYRIQVIAA